MRALIAPALVLGLLASACSLEEDGRGSDGTPGLPPVGSALPAISALTLDGRAVDNDTFKGKTTLLNLWFYH